MRAELLRRAMGVEDGKNAINEKCPRIYDGVGPIHFPSPERIMSVTTDGYVMIETACKSTSVQRVTNGHFVLHLWIITKKTTCKK